MLARIAGHSNVSRPSRYVHSSEDAVLTAMAKLGGHKMGHREEQTASSATVGLVLTRLLTDPDGTCPVRTKPSLQRRS
jgi:hypothetical protein